MTDFADRVPLSFGQQALWFFQLMTPDSSAYNIPLAWRLRGALRLDFLQRALEVVVERHEALRTAFRHDGDCEPCQVVLDPSKFDLTVCYADADTAVKVVEEVARTPFDLSEGRLLRAAVVRIDQEDHLFVLALHHIVGDGWSLRVLTNEIAAAYRALCDDNDPAAELPTLDVQFADYVLWHRSWLSEIELDGRLNHWEHALAGVPELDLTDGRMRPRRPTFAAERLLVDVDADVTAIVRAHAAATRTSLFSLLAAAFALVIHRRTGQDDIAFGTMLAGRVEPELEPLIGYFVNLVVLRVDLSADQSLTAVANRLAAAMLAAIDHEAPFGSVVERLAPPRRPGRNPICQVTMQLRTDESAPGVLDLSGAEAYEIDVYQGQHAFDLTLTFIDSMDALTISLEYSTEVFDRAWASGLADHLVATLRELPERNHDSPR